MLARQLSTVGSIKNMVYKAETSEALVDFSSAEEGQRAMKKFSKGATWEIDDVDIKDGQIKEDQSALLMHKVYFINLPGSTTRNDIAALLDHIPVLKIDLPVDIHSQSLGYAIVYLEHRDDIKKVAQ